MCTLLSLVVWVATGCVALLLLPTLLRVAIGLSMWTSRGLAQSHMDSLLHSLHETSTDVLLLGSSTVSRLGVALRATAPDGWKSIGVEWLTTSQLLASLLACAEVDFRAEHVFLYIGVNDLLHDDSPEAIGGRIARIADALRGRCARLTYVPIIASPLQRVLRNAEHIAAVNRQAERSCDDLLPLPTFGLRDFSDGLHLNRSGNVKLLSALARNRSGRPPRTRRSGSRSRSDPAADDAGTARRSPRRTSDGPP